jgi:hypothetical protein
LNKLNLRILTLCTLILTSSIFLSCSSDQDKTQTEENNFEDISKMAKDELFINLVDENERMINQITNLDKAKELTSKDYTLSNDELNELSVSLGFTNLNEHIDFYNNQKINLIKLNDKYNVQMYDESTLNELVLESYNENYLFKSNNCERVRRNCIVGAAADVTIVLGIVCHAAVVIGQAVISDTCNANAEDCENDQ